MERESSYIIKIKKTPKGPAPWGVRRAWKGLQLPAVEKPLSYVEFAPLKPVLIPEKPRFGFVVPLDLAIEILEQQGKSKAADWFKDNWPKDVNLSFGSDEVTFFKV